MSTGSRLIDISGQRFGRLLVIARDGHWNGRKRAAWLCRCDCGTERTFMGDYLRNGVTTSCGCYQRENTSQRKTTHGATKNGARPPEYMIWASMINRCTRETVTSFKYYGGRGIAVCDRWRYGHDGQPGFECFLSDMGRRPSPRHQIDRVENAGNYEPANCRWVTPTENARNRRRRGTA